ncbi:MAG: hypothetical protein KJO44_04275 [Gemmatimonadetes bacterium]|nr:hypothetical protein [Gemmatimonadota bacterium]NNC75055.1 hypothetical protein [Acidimicrobiia bacterium]
MSVCSGDPTKPGNWKTYSEAVADGDFDYLAAKPEEGALFVDSVQGCGTETPHVNAIGAKLWMSYHNLGAGNSQSTLLAISSDGVNFERVHGLQNSVILDYDPAEHPGDGHTGCFRWGVNPLLAWKYRYIGYSLHGGGQDPHSALWGSNDVLHWKRLDILDLSIGNACIPDRRMVWHQVDVNSIKRLPGGEYVGVTAAKTKSYGGRARLGDLYEVCLSRKGNELTRPIHRILPDTLGPRDEEQPSVLCVGETWYLVYLSKTGGKDGVNELHIASGTFELDPRP